MKAEKQIQFNPRLTSLAKQAVELIDNIKIEADREEVSCFSFNQVYGKIIVDDIVAMLQERMFGYDADERYLSAQTIETAMQMIRKRFG